VLPRRIGRTAPEADPREDAEEGPEGRHAGGQPQTERERDAQED
jgi:hypothetical protein